MGYVGKMQPRGLSSYNRRPYKGFGQVKGFDKSNMPDFSGSFPWDDAVGYGAGALGLASTLFAPSKRKGQTFQGATTAGMTALSLTGNPLIAGGAALAGGLYGAFTESPEEIREKRFNKVIEKTMERKNKALSEGTTQIGKMTGGLAKRFRRGANKRALAMGRVSDAEAFEAPIAGRVANEGNQSLRDFITSTNSQYDDILMQLENAKLMGEDIDPNAIDYLSELAPVATEYAFNEKELDLFKKYFEGRG